MEDTIWIIIAIIMTIMAAFMAAYLSYYKRNIKELNRQISFVIHEDTNHLLTTKVRAKEVKELALLVNQSFCSVKEAKKKMIRTNQAFRESITGISHDLRTPLTSAGGFIQMLRKNELTAEQEKEYLEIIWERMENVRELLDQFFMFARIEADELKLSLEQVDLTNLFYDTLSLYYKDFADRNETPELAVPEEPVYVKGNPDAIKRVLTNLIYNALIHGNGGYRFEVVKEPEQVIFCCSNLTGTIRAEEVDYLFERFYTSDHSRSRRTTGLGLSVAKRLVELMGGTIGAKLVERRLEITIVFAV